MPFHNHNQVTIFSCVVKFTRLTLKYCFKEIRGKEKKIKILRSKVKKESERNRRKNHKKSAKSEKTLKRDKSTKRDVSRGKGSRRKYERSSSPKESKQETDKISDKSR